MTRIIEIGSTRIGIREIGPCGRTERRAAEQCAVSQILHELLGRDVEITHTPEGAPTLPGHHISISHSRRLAAVALDPVRPIGIDVEEQRPTLEKVRDRFITPDEIARLSDIPTPLLFAWTAKEAVYKADPAVGPDFIRDIELMSPTEARTPSRALVREPARTFTLHSIPLPPSLLTLAF